MAGSITFGEDFEASGKVRTFNRGVVNVRPSTRIGLRHDLYGLQFKTLDQLKVPSAQLASDLCPA